jgi:hypothetical protein
MGGSVALLVVGILWPGYAESLLRLLLAGLALGYVASRALDAGLPSATVHDRYSPFLGRAPDTGPSLPDVVRERRRMLRAADDPESQARALVPWPMARRLLHEITRRLAGAHGLCPDHPDDTRRIWEMVSEPTRTLLGLTGPGRSPDGSHEEDRSVPLGGLDDILDDLERL